MSDVNTTEQAQKASEAASIADITQVVQLFHHHSLHWEHADYLLLYAATSIHAFHVERDVKFLLALQLLYVARSRYGQPLVAGAHLYILETHRAVGSTHRQAQV